jgi:hypothetical protein
LKNVDVGALSARPADESRSLAVVFLAVVFLAVVYFAVAFFAVAFFAGTPLESLILSSPVMCRVVPQHRRRAPDAMHHFKLNVA